MTRCYLDTNFLYLHVRQPEGHASASIIDWRARVIGTIGGDAGVISALVLDELAYRLLLAWLRDDGSADPLSTYRQAPGAVARSMRDRLDTLWEAVDLLALDLVVTDRRVVDRAKMLLVEPGLGPRDAFHAAHAVEGGCPVIVSSDEGFDTVGALRRLGP